MNKTNSRALVACLLVAAAATCVSAQQKRITVPTDFPTIQKALGMADEGDTVFVRSGVYKENVTMVDDVILMGQDKKTTIIDGRRKGPVVTAADGAVLTGFTIRNGTTGILCKNTRPIIKDNIIVDNKGTGIHALVTLPDIVNNVIYRNLWTGIFLESVRGTRTSIDHNVIMENGYGGIFCANRTEVLIRNNIIMGNKQYGVFVGPDAVKTRIVSNNIYKNRLPFNQGADNQTTRTQNISVDPQFRGMTLFGRVTDFNLKAGSPCLAKGEEDTDIGLSATVTAVAKASAEFDRPFAQAEPTDDAPAVVEDVYTEQSQDMFSFAGGEGQTSSQGDDWAPSADAPEQITEAVVLHGVTFYSSESADLTQESYAALDEIFSRLDYYKDIRVEVAGHTDNQGTDDFNRRLSLDRARAVVNYLAERGIASSRMRARGYGADRPIESNETADGRAANRRVEIVPLK